MLGVVEKTTVKSDGFAWRKIEWRPLIIILVGAMLFLLGTDRFVVRRSFSFTDALYCCVAVVPAGLLLLVIAYVVQHARLVSVIPLLFAGLLVLSYPAFDIALGLALMGAVVAPAWSNWKSGKAPMESATATEGQSDADRL
jgi:hypothetical protein